MRFIYSIKFDNGKSSTCLSVERIYDPLRYFRAKFGEDSVIEVYERTGGVNLLSRLLLWLHGMLWGVLDHS